MLDFHTRSIILIVLSVSTTMMAIATWLVTVTYDGTSIVGMWPLLIHVAAFVLLAHYNEKIRIRTFNAGN